MMMMVLRFVIDSHMVTTAHDQLHQFRSKVDCCSMYVLTWSVACRICPAFRTDFVRSVDKLVGLSRFINVDI